MKTDSVRVLLALVVATALVLRLPRNAARLIGLADQLVPSHAVVNASDDGVPLVVSLLVTGVASTTNFAAMGGSWRADCMGSCCCLRGWGPSLSDDAAVFAWLPPPRPGRRCRRARAPAASQVVARRRRRSRRVDDA